MINRLLSATVLLGLAALATAKCPSIDNYVQISETETSITVGWDINTAEDPVLKYRLTINGLLTQEFLCGTAACTYTVVSLSACGDYTFDLTAVCEGPVDGPTGTLLANTAFVAPGGVGLLTDDGAVVTWSEPANANCVGYYEVCYTSSFLLETICLNEASTSFDYVSQVTTGCDELIISVKATTPDGTQQGPPSTIEVISPYGIPGQVQNYEVNFISMTDIMLLWDDPLEHPGCIKDFSIIYGPDDTTTTEQIVSANSNLRQEHTATLTNLDMCTLYLVQVQALSINNEFGPPAIEYMQTAEEAPEMIPNIEAVPDTDNIEITWGTGNPDSCLEKIKICISDPVTATHFCDETGSTGTGYGNYSVTGLSPCRGYTFVIEGVSPGGMTGPVYSNTTFTEDVAPGPVENLAVQSVGVDVATISWDKPLTYEECVNEYVITYTNLFEAGSKSISKSVELDDDDDDDRDDKDDDDRDDDDRDDDDKNRNNLLRADYQDTLAGLSSCVDYRIEVYGVSSSGYSAPIRETFATTDHKDAGDVRNLQLVEVSYHSVTVLWYAPDDKYCVDQYNAVFEEVGVGIIVEDSFTPTDSTANQFVHTFAPAGLKNCTTYDMLMDAYHPSYPNPSYVTINFRTYC